MVAYLAAHHGIEPRLEGLESSLVPEHELLIVGRRRSRTPPAVSRTVFSRHVAGPSPLHHLPYSIGTTPNDVVHLPDIFTVLALGVSGAGVVPCLAESGVIETHPLQRARW